MASRRVSRAPRRKLIWARMAPAITTLTRINAAVGGVLESQDLLQTFRSQAGITRGPVGLTVVRSRLQLSFQTSGPQFNDVLDGSGVYFGLKVVDFNEALFEETAEEPLQGPQLDPHADWMAWGRIPITTQAFTSAGAITRVGGSLDIDVKAMRKIDELGQTLMLVMQATDSSGVSPLLAHVASTSVLLALP